jgi:hypothetical protein
MLIEEKKVLEEELKILQNRTLVQASANLLLESISKSSCLITDDSDSNIWKMAPSPVFCIVPSLKQSPHQKNQVSEYFVATSPMNEY